jgi:hypothetical protein
MRTARGGKSTAREPGGELVYQARVVVQRPAPRRANVAIGPPRHLVRRSDLVVIGGILLQKSKVAGRLIFRENTKREAIADSYNLTRISEVAREFNVGR